MIGADKLWGNGLETAGEGIKIGVIDDGIDAKHQYFDPDAFSYPAGFPKGLKADTTPKVIVQRAFAPALPVYRFARAPFDPSENGSFHATHVAGIAAGDHNTPDGALFLSGVAPDAYLGNYKALTIPTPGFGLDGNSAQIAAAIESAVSDGMNVINLSIGEPEISPQRDFVVHAIDAAAQAGVVPVIAADNQFDQYGYGSISSPANAPDAITVAATTVTDTIADFSSGGPTPVSLQLKPDVAAPGVAITSSLPVSQGGPYGALNGTSMATPQVSGAVALLMQRHPSWTVAQIKSALVQTGDPVHDLKGNEVSVLREGGGLVNLVRADNPLLFAAPSSVTFPVNGGSVPITLSDAGGGAGTWSVSAPLQAAHRGVTVSVDGSVSVPGRLDAEDHGLAERRERRRHRLRDPHPRDRHPSHPVLGRGRPPAARPRACGDADPFRHLPGDDRRRGAARLALPLPDRRRCSLSRARGRLSRARDAPGRELRCRRALRARDPARRLRRRRESPRRLPRAPDRHQSRTSARSARPARWPVRSCLPPGRTRSSSTRAPPPAPGRSRSATG